MSRLKIRERVRYFQSLPFWEIGIKAVYKKIAEGKYDIIFPNREVEIDICAVNSGIVSKVELNESAAFTIEMVSSELITYHNLKSETLVKKKGDIVKTGENLGCISSNILSISAEKIINKHRYPIDLTDDFEILGLQEKSKEDSCKTKTFPLFISTFNKDGEITIIDAAVNGTKTLTINGAEIKGNAIPLTNLEGDIISGKYTIGGYPAKIIDNEIYIYEQGTNIDAEQPIGIILNHPGLDGTKEACGIVFNAIKVAYNNPIAVGPLLGEKSVALVPASHNSFYAIFKNIVDEEHDVANGIRVEYCQHNGSSIIEYERVINSGEVIIGEISYYLADDGSLMIAYPERHLEDRDLNNVRIIKYFNPKLTRQEMRVATNIIASKSIHHQVGLEIGVVIAGFGEYIFDGKKYLAIEYYFQNNTKKILTSLGGDGERLIDLVLSRTSANKKYNPSNEISFADGRVALLADHGFVIKETVFKPNTNSVIQNILTDGYITSLGHNEESVIIINPLANTISNFTISKEMYGGIIIIQGHAELYCNLCFNSEGLHEISLDLFDSSKFYARNIPESLRIMLEEGNAVVARVDNKNYIFQNIKIADLQYGAARIFNVLSQDSISIAQAPYSPEFFIQNLLEATSFEGESDDVESEELFNIVSIA